MLQLFDLSFKQLISIAIAKAKAKATLDWWSSGWAWGVALAMALAIEVSSPYDEIMNFFNEMILFITK